MLLSSTPYYVLSFALAKTKRQGAGGDLSVFNGAFGVDSLDILNAPDIDFGTFQLFPDTVNYGVQGTASNVQAPSRQFNKTLNDTVNWISTQAFTGLTWVLPLLTAAASDLRSATSY
jgi:hypothetical protein